MVIITIEKKLKSITHLSILTSFPIFYNASLTSWLGEVIVQSIGQIVFYMLTYSRGLSQVLYLNDIIIIIVDLYFTRGL